MGLFYKYMSKEYRMGKRGVIIEVEGGDAEVGKKDDGGPQHGEGVDESVREFEQHRRDYMQIISELRKKHPTYTMGQLESMAQDEIVNRGPKSRAYYRMQATKKMTGGKKKHHEEVVEEVKEEEKKKKKKKNPGFLPPLKKKKKKKKKK